MTLTECAQNIVRYPFNGFYKKGKGDMAYETSCNEIESKLKSDKNEELIGEYK